MQFSHRRRETMCLPISIHFQFAISIELGLPWMDVLLEISVVLPDNTDSGGCRKARALFYSAAMLSPSKQQLRLFPDRTHPRLRFSMLFALFFHPVAPITNRSLFFPCSKQIMLSANTWEITSIHLLPVCRRYL